MNDPIHQRGQAMEDMFFTINDHKLLDNIRAEMAAKEHRDALQSASGISDTPTLDALHGCGITPESLASVALIPLVAVAWSDNKMEDPEKAAILKAAESAGIAVGTASYQTMESWLNNPPESELLDTWKSYIGALKSTLEGPALNQLKNSVLGRAENVAKSAGGFLGLGNKVSDSEQGVLDDLAKAFD
ncbi:MAG: hypothetical protein ACI87E_004975 [Mariniblastus sp.]|jgi:hypothetical protein